jgi:streptomycin 6-kinase
MSDSHSALSADADRYLQFWSLQLVTHLATSVMGWVGLVRQSGGELAVLKVLSITGQREEGTAAAVLQAFDGRGVVRVLRAAPGALLMEYCEGPILLDAPRGDQDHIAVPILCDVVRRMREVRAARPTAVPTLTERCQALGALPSTSLASEDADLIEVARNVSADLLQSDTATLLHGDLHHGNVMSTRRHGLPAWVAIDPQGLWGDPAYEVANLFGNPLGHPFVTDDPGRPARLADELAGRLGLSRARVLLWALVHSCISAVWSIQDGHDPSHRLKVARRIKQAAFA